jgi:tetratricopeptide (TPR) repeat protein
MDSAAALRCKACNAAVDTTTDRRDVSTTCPQCGAPWTVFSDDTDAPGQGPVSAPRSDEDQFAELVIPGYELRRQIGRGGMGFVFEARQASLDRSVAIKVLAPHLSNDPQFAARFEAEAAALARLAHPNIVSIYERGRCGDRLYFVMEFVAGDARGSSVDLKSVIARRPLDDEEARRLIVQVMRALAVAHAEGIVHRDIKPGNILLDRHGNAKVADFGIACFGDAPERERFTQPAAAMGTYDYMAPEQRTDAATSDARADVYSTATMLYEMLVGRVPAGAFQPPSLARSGVHPAWDAVIARGMHPLRDERFPSMTAFLAAVEGLAFDAGAATPAGQTAVAAPFVRCHECEQPVRADAQFCPSCRSPQFLDCAKCGSRMRAALNGCEQCGADLQSQRRFERFLQMGTVALDRARTAEGVPDRIQAAQEAGVALARARKAADDDSAVAPLLAEANQIVETLAARAAGDAVRDKRFGEALAWLEAVLDVAPSRADAERLRTKLATERSRAIAEATLLRDAGRPREAVQILTELTRRFADDGEITELLRDCEQRATGLKAIIRDTVPKLMAEKKWWAVESIVRQLRDEKAHVAGLDELAARVENILGSVTRAVAQAETALQAGNLRQALRSAEAVLEKVADHPRALEARAAATAEIDSLRDVTGRLKATMNEGRWFAACAAADSMPPTAQSTAAIASVLAKATTGIELADRYAATVVTAVVGAGSMLAAAFVGGGMHDGLVSAMRQIDTGAALFGYRWPAALVLLGIPIGAGIGSAAAIAAALRRPMRRRLLALTAMIVPLFCLVALFFATEHRWHWTVADQLERFGRGSPVGLPSLETLKAGAANAALWIGSGLAIATCLGGLRGPSGATVWRAALAAGSAASLAVVYGQPSPSATTSGLNSALLVTAVSMFLGRADRKLYLLAMIAAGGLAGGCTGLLDHRTKWLGPILVATALFTAQTVFTRPRSLAGWFTDSSIVLVSVFGAPYLQRPLIRVYDSISIPTDAILIAWTLAAGVLAAHWARAKEIDRRLHIADRFATHQWAIRPAHPPH